MKTRLIVFSFVAVVSFAISGCPDPTKPPEEAGSSDPRPVTEEDVPDPALRSLFEVATEKPFAEITTADLSALIALDAKHDFEASGGIADLTGIELCTELSELNLDGNSSLHHIDPLASLEKLKTLALQGCPVADYSILGDMTSLVMLSISPSSVASISWLTTTNLPNLTGIGLHSHYELAYSEDLIDLIKEFPWKKFWIGLQLNELQFDELFEQVLEPNAGKLRSFGLYDASQLENDRIDRVSEFGDLRSLTIWNSNIVAINFITGLTGLKLLDLRGNTGLTDLSPIETLHMSGGLALDEDWTPLVNIESLEMDLTPGTRNREVVDYLIENGIPVLWELGNTVEVL